MRPEKILLFFLFYLLLNSVPAQQIRKQGPIEKFQQAEVLYNLDDPTEETDNKAIALFLAAAGSKELAADVRVKSLLYAGNLQQGHSRYNESKNLYQRALLINKNGSNRQDYNYEADLYLGTAMYLTGVVDSARYFFEEASHIAESFPNKGKLPERDRLYNSLGVVYYESGNYLQAKNYFITALAYASPADENYDNFSTIVQGNIANCLLKLTFYDSAIHIFRGLVQKAKKISLSHQNLAHAYLEKGESDSALNIYLTLAFPKGLQSIVVKNEIGRIYMEKNNFDKAEKYFADAIEENKELTGNVKNKEEALSYFYRSQLAFESGFLNESIVWINEALKEIHLSFDAKNIYDVPNDVSNFVSPITFFDILLFKGKLLHQKYKQDKKDVFLDYSLNTYIKAIEVSKYILRNFDNDDARIFFIENSRRVFDDAVKVAYEAATKDSRYLNDLLVIIESYKGNILIQRLQNDHVRQNSTIPSHLLKRELELKQIHAAYISQLNQTTNQAELLAKRERILKLQVELSRLQKSIDVYENGFFYNELYFEREALLGKLQAKIDRNTLLINYFISGNQIYVIYISHNTANVSRIHIDAAFHSHFNNFIEETYRIADGVRYNGYKNANYLYRYLLAPFSSVNSNYKRWVIIPDQYLYYLPFDALTTSSDGQQYLLLKHAISYHYSLHLALSQPEPPGTSIKLDSLLAFAPFSYPFNTGISTGVRHLPFSADEINIHNAKKMLRMEATKENFLKKYANYKYIHFGTHASLSPDSGNNWILFHPAPGKPSGSEKLFIHEIYNLNLHGTELVTLSACETAAGESVSGEGLLSLSRAFLYAGSSGIVSTLYKTDDKVTAFLMDKMYVYLDKGYRVDEALRQSKIDLIHSNQIHPKLKTANFWANFIYMGKLENGKSKSFLSSSNWLILIVLLTLVMFSGYLIVRSKRFNP